MQERAARTQVADMGSVNLLRYSLSDTTRFLLSQNISKYKVPAEWYAMYRLREKTLYTWQEERPQEESVKSVPAFQIQSTSL